MIYNQLVSSNISFFEAHMIYKITHGQWVLNYAGSTKASIHRSALKTDVSWVWAQPVTWKQRPAASVTSRPLPSVSQSVGTTTRVADVKKNVAPVKSSPPKKGPKSNKPTSQKQPDSPVHESDAYFTVKTTTTNVEISNSVQNFYLEQRTTEEILSGFRFFYLTSKSHPVVLNRRDTRSKRLTNVFCFLIYIRKDLWLMIYFEMFPSAPTKLMYH